MVPRIASEAGAYRLEVANVWTSGAYGAGSHDRDDVPLMERLQVHFPTLVSGLERQGYLTLSAKTPYLLNFIFYKMPLFYLQICVLNGV